MVEPDQRLSMAIENYLKTIYALQRQEGQVGTNDLAERLQVKPASVSGMLKKLSELKYVEHTPYRGVVLTPRGQKVALEILRHHRLIELFLVEALGYSWDEVHDEAEELEHVISEKLEGRIAAWLGHPTRDPHGDPIPSPEGVLPGDQNQPLSDLAVGSQGIVRQVLTQEADRLCYLGQLGLVPGARVELRSRQPFEGPLTLQIGDQSHVIDSRMAQSIVVEDIG
jgi:DtxR family transcriptional regulator, Mn-dependent transcriptional regulator